MTQSVAPWARCPVRWPRRRPAAGRNLSGAGDARGRGVDAHQRRRAPSAGARMRGSSTGLSDSAPPEPAALPPREGSSFRRLLRLFGHSRPYHRRLAIALASLLITSGLGLAFPRFAGQAIDAAFTAGDIDELNEMTLVLVGIFLGQAVFVFFRHYLMSWVGERVVADLRTHVYARVVTMPQSFFHRERTGELLSRLTDDVSRLQDTVGQDLSLGLRNLLTLVGGVGLLLWLNPKLTTVMLAVVPPLVLVASAWGRVIRKLSRQAQDLLADANGSLSEGIAGIETVQAFTREDHEVDRYRRGIEKTFALFVAQIRARSWFMSTSSFLAFGSIAGIFWLGGNMVINGEITAGALTEFFLYTMAVAAAVGALSGLYGRFHAAVGATGRIFELLDAVPEIRDAPDAEPVGAVTGELAFEGVTFAYGDRATQVVHDLNLTIPAGSVCALVGASGSGKTTLGRMLLRFWDPVDGRVTLDGRDLRRLRLAQLRASMAVVSQDPVLFSGSIRDNIRYGRLEATDVEVEQAARAANAHGFITGFPDGYDTVVGERGVKLSGGQRQRVSIARAILRDPKVLILDEATSALDAESEATVQQALESLQRGRTTVVIAHRLSTIRDADNIVVLEDGQVVEQGTHDELMVRHGSYARLVARQAHASDELGPPGPLPPGPS
ncbi:MAG: ATP-binding cassette domain-containing protein [Myxococcales bacterium FL481]|nr:MAG: ATP-binding cassette domain-containing protein [Myxococcales bacterium FL481]